jgi:serine/threonine protein phosphatase 1
MKRYVIGDIHGRYEALMEVLDKVNFDYNEDKLFVIGDVVDGGRDSKKVIDELLKIKNLIYIYGNHDLWLIDHIKSGWYEEIWLQQGGKETLKSYGASFIKCMSDVTLLNTEHLNIPCTHQDFFNKGKYYHIEDEMLFVHGGFRPEIGIEHETKHNMVWDRDLIEYAREGNIIKPYDYVFVGHTTTQFFDSTEPVRFKNLFMMDCGAGWNGRLAIMDIDTKKFETSKIQKGVK